MLRATRQRHHRRVAETLMALMPEVARTQPERVAHHLDERDLRNARALLEELG